MPEPFVLMLVHLFRFDLLLFSLFVSTTVKIWPQLVTISFRQYDGNRGHFDLGLRLGLLFLLTIHYSNCILISALAHSLAQQYS